MGTDGADRAAIRASAPATTLEAELQKRVGQADRKGSKMTGIRQLLWSVIIRCARGASLLLVAPVSLLPLAAVAQSALVEAQPLATPLTVVAPAFPPNMSAPASGVRVDVVGTVLANGEIKPTSITADNEQRPFVDAVIDVLRWWRFVPAIDKQRCAPKDSESRFSIWFEGSAATPKIYFSFPKRETASDGGSNWVESIRAPKVEYPIDLLGVEGQVQVLYLVSPDGKVKSA